MKNNKFKIILVIFLLLVALSLGYGLGSVNVKKSNPLQNKDRMRDQAMMLYSGIKVLPSNFAPTAIFRECQPDTGDCNNTDIEIHYKFNEISNQDIMLSRVCEYLLNKDWVTVNFKPLEYMAVGGNKITDNFSSENENCISFGKKAISNNYFVKAVGTLNSNTVKSYLSVEASNDGKNITVITKLSQSKF